MPTKYKGLISISLAVALFLASLLMSWTMVRAQYHRPQAAGAKRILETPSSEEDLENWLRDGTVNVSATEPLDEVKGPGTTVIDTGSLISPLVYLIIISTMPVIALIVISRIKKKAS